MAYREQPDPAAPPRHFTYYRSGPVARGTLAIVCGGAAVFLAVMTVCMTEDSWLTCSRTADGAASCSERSVYPFGVASQRQLPPVWSARTATRIWHDRYGDHPAEVLVLDSRNGVRTEFDGVGTNGARAATVSTRINVLLQGSPGTPAR